MQTVEIVLLVRCMLGGSLPECVERLRAGGRVHYAQILDVRRFLAHKHAAQALLAGVRPIQLRMGGGCAMSNPVTLHSTDYKHFQLPHCICVPMQVLPLCGSIRTMYYMQILAVDCH